MTKATQQQPLPGREWKRVGPRSPEKSRIYFPLPGNAATLVRGKRATTFERSVKAAALLYDEVFLDDGEWTAEARPGGAAAWTLVTIGDFHIDYQSPYSRRAPLRPPGSRGIVARADDGSQSIGLPNRIEGRTVYSLHSPDLTLLWKATFRPIKLAVSQLSPSDREWITFGYPDAVGSEGAKRDVPQTTGQLILAPLPAEAQSQAAQDLVIHNVRESLEEGAILDATVHFDDTHRLVLAAMEARGDARVELGPQALQVLFPDLLDESWATIAHVRRHPGMPALRGLLRRVELAARSSAKSPLALDAQIMREFQGEAISVFERLTPSFRQSMGAMAVSAGFTLLTGPLGMLGEVATHSVYSAGKYALDGRRADGTWMSAALSIQRAAARKSRGRA